MYTCDKCGVAIPHGDGYISQDGKSLICNNCYSKLMRPPTPIIKPRTGGGGKVPIYTWLIPLFIGAGIWLWMTSIKSVTPTPYQLPQNAEPTWTPFIGENTNGETENSLHTNIDTNSPEIRPFLEQVVTPPTEKTIISIQQPTSVAQEPVYIPPPSATPVKIYPTPTPYPTSTIAPTQNLLPEPTLLIYSYDDSGSFTIGRQAIGGDYTYYVYVSYLDGSGFGMGILNSKKVSIEMITDNRAPFFVGNGIFGQAPFPTDGVIYVPSNATYVDL